MPAAARAVKRCHATTILLIDRSALVELSWPDPSMASSSGAIMASQLECSHTRPERSPCSAGAYSVAVLLLRTFTPGHRDEGKGRTRLCWRPWARCRQVLIGVWSSRVAGTVSESGRFTTARLREWGQPTLAQRLLRPGTATWGRVHAMRPRCGPWAGRAGSSHLLGVARAVPGCTFSRCGMLCGLASASHSDRAGY